MTRNKSKASQANRKSSWKNWGDHPIVVIVGTISSLIAIGIGIATVLPNQSTPSNSSDVSSAAATPFFNISTPTNTIYYDDFSDPTSGWDEKGYTTGWYKILYDSWNEKSSYIWENIGIMDGIYGIRVSVLGPFEKNGTASRGVIFGSNNGNTREPFSFSLNKDGLCKLSRYYADSEYGGWHSVTEEQIKGFDSNQSFYILEIQITNYRQAAGFVDGKLCIDTVLEDYAPGFVGLYATPTNAGPDYGVGESFFDDFYIYRP